MGSRHRPRRTTGRDARKGFERCGVGDLAADPAAGAGHASSRRARKSLCRALATGGVPAHPHPGLAVSADLLHLNTAQSADIKTPVLGTLASLSLLEGSAAVEAIRSSQQRCLRLIDNLLLNAVRHNLRGQRVWLQLSRQEG